MVKRVEFISYVPVNFDEVVSVRIVDYTDEDYHKWTERRKTLPNNNAARERRIENIQKYPKLFNEIRNLWTSESFEKMVIEKSRPICLNCNHFSEDRYFPNNYICWLGWNGGRPKRTIKTSVCQSFLMRDYGKMYWFQKEVDALCKKYNVVGNIINGGNIKSYLADMDLIDRPTTGFKIGKGKEIEYLNKLHLLSKNLSLEWLPKIYKITMNSGYYLFKEMDAFLRNDKEVFLQIEYKVASYDKNERQILDYIELLKRSQYLTEEQLKNCFFFLIFKEHAFDLSTGKYGNYKRRDLSTPILRLPHINEFQEEEFISWLMRSFI